MDNLKIGKIGNNKKHSYEFIKAEFEKVGFELLEAEYNNAHTKMEYKCPNHPNEILKMNYANLSQGGGCPKCANEKAGSYKKLNINIAKEIFEDKGYELLDDTYINSETKMKYKCPFHPDKEQSISLTKLKQGRGCRFCG